MICVCEQWSCKTCRARIYARLRKANGGKALGLPKGPPRGTKYKSKPGPTAESLTQDIRDRMALGRQKMSSRGGGLAQSQRRFEEWADARRQLWTPECFLEERDRILGAR